ncbi:hypothetical protein ARMSODRAFT_975217 [Armillaria solidipes]|uniref:Uncharacterized protein n=1 Tax=Armillaria solidipes TaxID=1076256 RepID=A0A2H3C030_9AGAR|nr:hypothetical protein ARMSODRAFT_975217 [Armillaria solidipes]
MNRPRQVVEEQRVHLCPYLLVSLRKTALSEECIFLRDAKVLLPGREHAILGQSWMVHWDRLVSSRRRILASSPPQREATAGGGSPVLTCIDITTLSLKQRVSAATSYRSRTQRDDVSNKPAISQHNDSRMDNPTLPGLRSECGVGTITDTRELTLLSLQHAKALQILDLTSSGEAAEME